MPHGFDAVEREDDVRRGDRRRRSRAPHVPARLGGDADFGLEFNLSLIVGGQIRGEPPRLFNVYNVGNFIESTAETPYFQLGEAKYGKPILDRVITASLSLHEAAKCALVSMDSTMKSNLSVGLAARSRLLPNGQLRRRPAQAHRRPGRVLQLDPELVGPTAPQGVRRAAEPAVVELRAKERPRLPLTPARPRTPKSDTRIWLVLPPSSSPSDASELRRRSRLALGDRPQHERVLAGSERGFRRDSILAATEPRALRRDALLDDRPARQRTRARAFRFRSGDEAIIVVGRHELHDRGLVSIGIHAGDVREVDLEYGVDSRARACSGRRERPDGRAVLVGTEQAAERRRDAADGRIHERERLAREALQTLDALTAPACCRPRTRLARSSARSRFGPSRRRATRAARVRARRRRIGLAPRLLGRFLLRGQAARSSRSASRTRPTLASRPTRPRARDGSGAAARFCSASAAIIASMTRSETPPPFNATSARGDRSNSTRLAWMTAMIVESLNCGADHLLNVGIRDGRRCRGRGRSRGGRRGSSSSFGSATGGRSASALRAGPGELATGSSASGAGSSTARGPERQLLERGLRRTRPQAELATLRQRHRAAQRRRRARRKTRRSHEFPQLPGSRRQHVSIP